MRAGVGSCPLFVGYQGFAGRKMAAGYFRLAGTSLAARSPSSGSEHYVASESHNSRNSLFRKAKGTDNIFAVFKFPKIPPAAGGRGRAGLTTWDWGIVRITATAEAFTCVDFQRNRREMDFVAIDFETANYAQDSACAIGLVKVVGGEIVETAVHFIRPPGRRFAFTYIHGLTWDHVAEADDFGTLWPKLTPLLEGARFLAAHNASFDRGVLNACCARYGLSAPAAPFRCTVRIARRTWNIYPTKLSNVCEELGIALNHHEALSDAMACAKIVLAANAESWARVSSSSKQEIHP